MRCPNCGTENIQGSTFCIKCGTNLKNINQGNDETMMTPVQRKASMVESGKEIFQNKKLIFGFLLLLIVGIGVVFYGFIKNNSFSTMQNIDLNAIFDPNRLIVIEKDDKYGYIDASGNEVVKPIYQSASTFYGDYAVVTLYDENATYYSKKTYQIIDKKGNVMITSQSYSKPYYNSDYGFWIIDGKLYDSKLHRVLSEETEVDYESHGYLTFKDPIKNETGIVTYTGKKVFSCPGTYLYVNISDSDSDDLYALVTISGISEQEMVLSLKTGKVLFRNSDPDNIYLVYNDDGIFYYYPKEDSKNTTYLYFGNGKLLYQTKENLVDLEVYDSKNRILELDYGSDYEELGKTSRYVYYDANKKKMLSEKPILGEEFDAMLLTYGYKTYTSSSKVGIMDKSKSVLPADYEDIDFLNVNLYQYMKSKNKQELVLLTKDKQTSLMNLKNKQIITTFDTTYVSDYDKSTFLKATLYENNSYRASGYLIYNVLTGASMKLDAFEDFTIGSNYFIITEEDQTIYYNTKLEKIYVQE